jgi:hypothetical protein
VTSTPLLGRSRHGLLLASVLVTVGGALVASADVPRLTEDTGFRVLTPHDGDRVGRDFLLSWTGGGTDSFAVVVDDALPRPGDVVAAGKNVVTVPGDAVRLTLGARSGGSPSARDQHVLVVVPLDAQGRRIGEQTAVVHVRSRP